MLLKLHATISIIICQKFLIKRYKKKLTKIETTIYKHVLEVAIKQRRLVYLRKIQNDKETTF